MGTVGDGQMVETDFVVVRRLEIVKNGVRWDRVETEVGVKTDLVVHMILSACREVLKRGGAWERGSLSSISLSSCTEFGKEAHLWLGRHLTWK